MGSGTLTCVILPVELSRTKNLLREKEFCKDRCYVDRGRCRKGILSMLLKNIEKVRSFSVYDARGERKNIAGICL